MTPRQQQKEQTRERILQAAYQLFASQGITATRTADVAQAARVSHGAVFAHFPNREDLVVAVIERFAKRLVVRLEELTEQGASVREVLAAHLAGLAEQEAFYARLVSEGPLLPPYARTFLLGIQSVIARQLERAVQLELTRGAMRPMAQHMLFNTWLGLVHHYVVNRDLFAPKQAALQARANELLDHFLGLLTP